MSYCGQLLHGIWYTTPGPGLSSLGMVSLGELYMSCLHEGAYGLKSCFYA